MSIANYPPVVTSEVKTDRWTEPFWAAASRRELVVAACNSCGHVRMPPGPYCPVCLEQGIEWKPVSGRGVIFSFTVVRRPIIPEMKDYVPYVPAVVTLDGGQGSRLVGAVVESAIERICIDAPVEVVWCPGGGGQLVPQFRLLT